MNVYAVLQSGRYLNLKTQELHDKPTIDCFVSDRDWAIEAAFSVDAKAIAFALVPCMTFSKGKPNIIIEDYEG